MHPAIQAVLTVGVAVIAAIGYFYLSNLLLDRVLFPARGKNAGRNINRANMIRPWLFLFPALFALCLYLAERVKADGDHNLGRLENLIYGFDCDLMRQALESVYGRPFGRPSQRPKGRR